VFNHGPSARNPAAPGTSSTCMNELGECPARVESLATSTGDVFCGRNTLNLFRNGGIQVAHLITAWPAPLHRHQSYSWLRMTPILLASHWFRLGRAFTLAWKCFPFTLEVFCFSLDGPSWPSHLIV